MKELTKKNTYSISRQSFAANKFHKALNSIVKCFTIIAFTLLLINVTKVNIYGQAADNFDPLVTGQNQNPATVTSIAVQPDGKILFGGDFVNINGLYRPALVRVNADGTSDTSFKPILGTVRDIVLQPDGRILIAGDFSKIYTEGDPAPGPAENNRNGFARLNSNGTLDTTFDSNYNPTLDTGFTFLQGNSIRSIALQADGKTLISGSFTYRSNKNQYQGLARMNSNGTVDETFNPPSFNSSNNGSVYVVTLQANGKILVGGGFKSVNGEVRQGLVSLNINGTVDTTFLPPLTSPDNSNNTVTSITVQPNGGILVGGNFAINSAPSTLSTHLIRLDTVGALDTTFTPNINNFSNTPVNISAIQSDGKILIGGNYVYQDGQQLRTGFQRLNPNGTTDTSFNPESNGYVDDIVIQPDGKILVGGSFTRIGGAFRSRVARLFSEPQPSTCTTQSIAFGQTINGSLTTSDCLHSVIHYYDAYSFTGISGQKIAIAINSSKYGTHLQLYNSSGTSITFNDGGLGNARIPSGSGYYTLPASGTYTIRARSSSLGVTGGYALTLTTEPIPPPVAPTNVTTSVISSSQINVSWNPSPASENVTSYNFRVNGATVTNGVTSPYQVTNLTPNTTYTFEVQAVNSAGASNWSTPVSATTNPVTPPPSAPTGISPQVVSSSQINISWNPNPANENVTSYNLRVNGSTVTTGVTSPYQVKNLTPNTTYTFEVQAVNSVGVSNWSAPVSAKTLENVPMAPTNVATSVISSTQINVSWNTSPANENVTSYNLRVNGSTVITGVTSPFQVTNLTPNTTYSFEVQAVNSAGVSNWSTPVNATTNPVILPPNAPTNIRATAASTSQINVFWDASTSPNITSYNLRVNGTTVISNITFLSYAVKNLTPNTTYSFEVQAVNSAGVVSAWTTPINATTNPLIPLNLPTNVRANAASSTQINVFWNASTSPNITSYNLRVNGSTVIPGITYLSWAVKNLNPSTTYSFEVQAVDSSGNVSNWTAPVNATTNPVAPPPNAPTNIRGNAASSTQINVFWDASTSPNIASYNLRINGSTVISNITYLSWAVRNLTPNTTYSFEVQAVDSSGNISNWTNPISVTTNPVTPPPNTPTNVRGNAVSSTQINVFWDGSNSPNVTSYNLRVNGSAVIPNITYLSWAVTNLTPGTTYTFEVQAVNSSGVPSAWTTPISITSNPIAPPPNAPTNIRASGVSTSQINVFWDASTSQNVVSYNLRVNGGTPITGITYLSWAVRNLTPNTTYTFEVQAVNSSGVPSNWSAPVNATTLAIAVPGNLRASVVSASQINLFWDGVSTPGVTSYQLRINGSTIISNITYLSWAVTGLNPSTSYTFEVRSVDSTGNVSNWSNPVQATTLASSQPETFSMFDFLNGFDFLNLAWVSNRKV